MIYLAKLLHTKNKKWTRTGRFWDENLVKISNLPFQALYLLPAFY